MLVGSRVRLRAVEPADYPVIARWLNDASTTVYWGIPGNTESIAEVARREEENAQRPNARKYIIETHEAQPIGQIDYYDLEWKNRSAWVSILIGQTDFWGGGYGTEAMRLLLGYLFQQLGMHRISLTVHRRNERARRSYAKNGFVEEGALREWHYFDGRWEDGVLMSVLDREFLAGGPGAYGDQIGRDVASSPDPAAGTGRDAPPADGVR